MRGVVDVAPYNYYVLMPVVSTQGGARAARATLIIAVYYLNVRVRADIDVISSHTLIPNIRKFWESRDLFQKVFGKNQTQTNTPTNTNLSLFKQEKKRRCRVATP